MALILISQNTLKGARGNYLVMLQNWGKWAHEYFLRHCCDAAWPRNFHALSIQHWRKMNADSMFPGTQKHVSRAFFYDAHTWMEIAVKVQNCLAVRMWSPHDLLLWSWAWKPTALWSFKASKNFIFADKMLFVSVGALMLSLRIHGSRTWDASAPGRRCLEGIFNLSEWRSGAKCIWEEEMTAQLNHHLTPTCGV